MVGGKYSGGEWKINEERMENLEIFKFLGMWFGKGIRGNVHLEKLREKLRNGVWTRIGCMSRVNGEMEVDRGKLILELLARSCLEYAYEVCTRRKAACMNLEKIQENIGRKLVGGSSTVSGVAVRTWAGRSWRREGKKRNYYLDGGCRE